MFKYLLIELAKTFVYYKSKSINTCLIRVKKKKKRKGYMSKQKKKRILLIASNDKSSFEV